MNENTYTDVVVIKKEGHNYTLYFFKEINGELHNTLIYNDCSPSILKDFLKVKIDFFEFHNDDLIAQSGTTLYHIEDYMKYRKKGAFHYFNEQIVEDVSQRELLNLSAKKNFVLKRNVISFVLITSLLGTHVAAFTTKSTSQQPMVESSIEPVVSTEIMTPKESFISAELEIEPTSVVSRSLSSEEIQFMNVVQEYSRVYSLDYDTALKVIRENQQRIENESITEEAGIIQVLAETYSNDDSIDKKPIIENIPSSTREALLLEYAGAYGISDEDTLATILAIYRLETGRGTSDALMKYNNYGGLMYSRNGESVLCRFQTAEIGAAAQIKTFFDILEKSKNRDSYHPNKPLEENLYPVYCPEESWVGKIKEMKKEVYSDYNLEHYVVEEAPKILIRTTEN